MFATQSVKQQKDAKTPICRFFLANECKKGESCPFRHESLDGPIKSDTICKYFLEGKSCKYGTFCWFRHEKKSPTSSINTKTLKENLPFNIDWTEKRSYSEVFKSNFNPDIFKNICPTCYLGEPCPNGENCKFIHGTKCLSCGLNVIHPFNTSKNLEHIQGCIKRSEYLLIKSKLTQSSVGKTCAICTDEIFGLKKFGLLPECDHSFCLDCIVEWRAQKEEFDKNVRSCPLCKTISYFVVPSMYFHVDSEEKKTFIENYKSILKQKVCRNFTLGFCELGDKCFFRHETSNGTVVNGSRGRDEPGGFYPHSLAYLQKSTLDEKDESLLHKKFSV